MSKSRETVTEKRTVITSSSSSNYDDAGDTSTSSFKSTISPRNTVLARSPGLPGLRTSGLGGDSGTVITRTVEYGYGNKHLGGLPSGGYEQRTNTGVNEMKHNREKEKKDMQDLNERFASYIEKVRFLEAQNRKLGSELEHLKSKWGKETSQVKQMYETELGEARKLIDDLTREKANLEIKNNSLQEQMSDMQRQLDEAKKYRSIDREQIQKLNQQLSDYEGEINMLRRTIESLETDRQRDRDRVSKLQSDIDRLRMDLNNETLNHLDAENRRQTLEEEMVFLKNLHEQELKELAALAYRDTTEENREFWKNELSSAIRDIQREYDQKSDQIRGDMEAYYNLKVQEFRTGATKQNMEVTHVREENKKLVKQMSDLRGRLADLEARNAQLEKQYQDMLREYEQMETDHTLETATLREEITKMRSEMESILQELQTLMDAKLSLELEILAYRKLLEGEETRVGLRNVVEEAVNSQSRGASHMSEMISGYESKGDSSVSMRMMRGEVSAKTTYQRTSTGPLSVSEVSPEGKFIVLENTSSGTNKREVDLNKWRLKRTVDGQRDYIYEFRNFALKPGKSVKIFARGSAGEAGLNDLVFRDEETWGFGAQVTTVLLNEKNEEKATHTQKTKYQ